MIHGSFRSRFFRPNLYLRDMITCLGFLAVLNFQGSISLPSSYAPRTYTWGYAIVALSQRCATVIITAPHPPQTCLVGYL